VGGRTDAILMRIVDVLYSLPYILIVILLRVAFAPPLGKWFGGSANAQSWANVTILLIGIGSVSWLTMARIIRGQVLALRTQPFVEAAQALGLRPAAVLLKHILPNLLGTIIVYATLTVPRAILEESFLSFLGLGISPPLPSWGNIASDGVATINPISNWWWLTLLPSAAISITLLCLNFVGDGLRDALDPRSNR
jgi:oligopeptide transport system permease protein